MVVQSLGSIVTAHLEMTTVFGRTSEVFFFFLVFRKMLSAISDQESLPLGVSASSNSNAIIKYYVASLNPDDLISHNTTFNRGFYRSVVLIY